MKTKIFLFIFFLSVLSYNTQAKDKQGTEKTIIEDLQKKDGMFITPLPAFSFCVSELISVMQQDSIFDSYWKRESNQIKCLENKSKDFYITKLLQAEFLKKSFKKNNTINNNRYIKQFIDSLELIPEYKLEKNEMYLFFNSYSDASGIVAEKIETLLLTQNTNDVFEYIQNDEFARKRFIEWVNDDIEVWYPTLASDNIIIKERISRYLYKRLKNAHQYDLAQLAAKKIENWFDY